MITGTVSDILKKQRWLELGCLMVPFGAFIWIAFVSAQDGRRGVVVAAGVVAAIVTFVAGWLFRQRAGSFVKPIAAAKEIVAGNLTAKFEVSGSEELRDLMEAMNRLNERMFQLISDVRTRSTTVVGTSSAVSRDTETLRVRTTMQIESLQQTIDSMTRLNDIVQRNSEQMTRADELVSAASTHAADGGKAMNEVVATMGSIRERSRKIVDIIALIDSIAFQTNILALNAAVEAARAGEHGRGFAIVANEVGTLAKRSATAAKEIKSLINDSVSTIASGSKLVDNAGTTIVSILSSVQSLTSIIQEISSSGQEQHQGIASVNTNIGEVMRINKSNARMFADIIKASNTLNEQAVTLLKSLAGFNLGIREHATPEEAHAMVKRAVEFLHEHGRERFLAEANKPDSHVFIERDLYVFVFDANTYKYLANGVNPRIINYDGRLVKDTKGRTYIEEMIDLARRQGECWIEYGNNHPVTNEPMEKRTFAQCVDNMVIACGAYKLD